MEQNQFSNFGRRSPKEHFCDLAVGLRGDVFKGFSIFSSDGHFVQQSGTILATLVESHQRNISEKLF